MQEDKHLQALNCEVELVSEDAYRGERLQVFYREKCSYVEMYPELK